MSPQTLFIDHDTGAVTGGLVAIRGTTLRVHVCFLQASAPFVQPVGTTGKLVAKRLLDQDGEPVLLDAAWAVTGTGNATRYVFEVDVDNVELAAFLAGKSTAPIELQFEWKLTAETKPRASLPIELLVINGPSRPEDGLPTAALSLAWEWLKAALIAGTNMELVEDEEDKTLTLNAAGGSSGTTDHGGLIGLADDDHTQYHNNARGDLRYSQLGHTHTKDQVGLANADNTSDATKQAATLAASFGRFLDFVNAQTVSHAQRRRITGNAGLDVTLHAELIGPASAVASGSYFAFTLPKAFVINSAYLTVALDTEGGSALITGALIKEDVDGTGAVNLATFTDSTIPAGRVALIEDGESACALGSRILVDLSATTPPYAGTLNGLSLWLHGYWS